MACFISELGGNGTVEDSQCLAHNNRVTGEKKTARKRHTQHPLTHGLMRQDFVNQQRGAIRHTPSPATCAESPPFTAERDQFFIMAGFTADLQESVFKPSKFEVFIKLFSHICRQIPAMAVPFRLKLRPVLPHKLVSQGRLGPVAYINCGGFGWYLSSCLRIKLRFEQSEKVNLPIHGKQLCPEKSFN